MNKNYETVFIINPVLSEKQVEDTVKKYKKQLDGKKVKFVCNESLGFKELAYPINKKNSGFYHLFQYESDDINIVKELEIELKRDRSILRYMTVSLCKDGVEFNARRASGEFNKKKTKK
ncbi:MAG: 30S ribosomal protein S6 [Bacteroidota bacterium]|jgi:small subunit ribosomal protein S6|nr:30S ribosomal protein S6 [Bacteroidota bacterium]MEC8222084.1 30S ribosomal protein S6 [Bacteroidota bacterium]|tara:strand:+ start:1086 stop:1442 length:357 start_codon:yes stop_codon:yes gene_type:complete